jgi:SAM-dependent methyltransferase
MWRVLCNQFFQHYVSPDDVVLELGAGYCEFLNQIRANRKIAVDLNPDTARYADPGVEVQRSPSTDLSAIADDAIDVVFASNFFEHLSRPDIARTMTEAARVLRPNGHFLILQPNYRYCYRDYWRFFDHITPLDHHSLSEALETSGFRVLQVVPRFLPYTVQSRYPRSTLLLRAYLHVPLLWRLLGQQMFCVAQRAK